MMRLQSSNLVLYALFLVLLIVLLVFRDALYLAHVDESIIYLSSDGSVYFSSYQTEFYDKDIMENWEVFIRYSPTLFMMLADGNLFYVQLFNLFVMLVALRAVLGCFSSLASKMIFLFFTIIFPYFILGFLSLNKEVYAMSAAMFYISYMTRGRFIHLIFAIFFAMCARYYMVASIAMLLFCVPRHRAPRWVLIGLGLVVISFAAPNIKQFIPQYSSENLLDSSGATAGIFDGIISSYGYALLYPVKYALLPLIRPYGFLIGSTHDAIGAIVSALSLIAIGLVGWKLFSGARIEPIVKRLIVAGFVAPIPMMWSEIMHWRYYSFVYFFFLAALVLDFEARERAKRVSARAKAAEIARSGRLGFAREVHS